MRSITGAKSGDKKEMTTRKTLTEEGDCGRRDLWDWDGSRGQEAEGRGADTTRLKNEGKQTQMYDVYQEQPHPRLLSQIRAVSSQTTESNKSSLIPDY